jgi:hypothetical protein
MLSNTRTGASLMGARLIEWLIEYGLWTLHNRR